MPDITMCTSKECPSFNRCYRGVAIPNSYHQCYAPFNPIGCEYFINVMSDFNQTAFDLGDESEPFRG